MAGVFGKLRDFVRRDDGSQTIEAVIWLPIFVAFLALVIDVSTIYNRQAEMMRVVHDATRSYSTGKIASAELTEKYIENAVKGYAASADAVTTIDNGIIHTTLKVIATDLMPIDIFEPFREKYVVVSIQQLAEF